MRFISSVFFILSVFGFSHAQVLDFTNPASACLQEQIALVNSSTNVSGGFQWDFCEGELLKSLETTLTYRINGIDQAAGIITVQDAGNYYSFVIDRGTNSLHRLQYGTSLRDTPVRELVELPIGTSLLSPQGFNLIRVSNSWYGFVVSTGNNKIYRLDFGSLITNSPTAVEIDFSSNLNIPIEIEIALEAGEYYLGIINFSGNNLVVGKLGNSIANQPQSFNVVALPGASSPYGFSMRKFNDGKWRGIIGSFSNGNFHTVSFNTGLSQSPVVNNITSLFTTVTNPVKLALETWGDESTLLVMSATGFVQRVHFTRGSSLTSIESSDILNASSYGSPLTFSTFYDNGKWSALTFSNSSSDLQILYFDSTCGGVSQSYFSGEIPPVILFSETGLKDVSLLSNIDGILERKTHSIMVSGLIAPQIDYLSSGMCVGNALTFSSSSDIPISQYSWSFGDSQTSTFANPTHQYSSAGDYTVQLNVTAENGCNNFTEKLIKIYDPPSATFELPAGQMCTNNEFTFTNTTPDNFDGNLTYEWLVNDVQKSTTRDFKYLFTAEGDQQVKLKTTIPGCSDEMTQTVLNVQTGPVVNFSYSGKCKDETISFANESTGSISGYQWNFGNGSTSATVNPTHTYGTIGSYDVSLSATGTNGCASTLTKSINIYSVPQTDFSIDLPPFACSGSLSQFHDITLTMPDSNITLWQWSFGDASNGSATLKDPSYVYAVAGDYPVSLTTTSNYGCTKSIQKQVTIYPSPAADFSFGPACINKGTQFTDLSSNDVKSWLWIIQGNTYSAQNPIHIFKSASTYNAMLTATALNNCISQVSKNVTVPIPVITDFTFTNTCADAAAQFDEINKSGNDPAVSWSWSFDNQGSASGSPVQHVFTSTGNHTITMNSTRQSGCTYSVTRTIPIIEPPDAKFTIFLDAGAAPFPVDFVNSSSHATSYNWKFGDGANSTSTLFSPSFTYTTLGDYTAELIASNSAGCSDTFRKVISVVIPRINAAIADFRMEKIAGSENWRPVVTIENKSNVALINPDVYLDLSGNALIIDKLIHVIKPNESLTHTFTSAVEPRLLQFACAEVKVNADEFTFDNRQCVNLMDEFVSMVPYPNPARDEVILEWVNADNKPVELVVYNAAGQVVMSRRFTELSPGLNQVKLDVSKLQAGIYFASYSIDNHHQNFRFSIVR